MEDEVSTQYGVVYPDGTEEWNLSSWFGMIDDGPSQYQFKHQWVIRMNNVGVTVSDEDADKIKFMSRVATTTYSDETDITDHDYTPIEFPEP